MPNSAIESPPFIDFGRRARTGIIVASMRHFLEPPAIGSRFIGTDFEEFDGYQYEVVGWDRVSRRVFLKPTGVRPGPSDA
jgi:hypothetical protein